MRHRRGFRIGERHRFQTHAQVEPSTRRATSSAPGKRAESFNVCSTRTGDVMLFDRAIFTDFRAQHLSGPDRSVAHAAYVHPAYRVDRSAWVASRDSRSFPVQAVVPSSCLFTERTHRLKTSCRNSGKAGRIAHDSTGSNHAMHRQRRIDAFMQPRLLRLIEAVEERHRRHTECMPELAVVRIQTEQARNGPLEFAHQVRCIAGYRHSV